MAGLYTLMKEPETEQAKRAFSALDDAFGTEEFDKKSAQDVLVEHGFGKNDLDVLISGEYVQEVA